MPKDGDLIQFDYDLFVEGVEGVYDTTMKATAEKAGVVDPNAYYAPMNYLLGAGRLIKGLEDALKTLEVGKPTKIELAVENAYGPRDAKLIETIPIQEFRKNKVDPEVGLQINYKQRRGVVTYVGGGRIRVDFNHALAGKKLKYVVVLRHVAKSVEEKVRGIIQMNFPTSLTWDVEVKGDVVTIGVPDALRFEQQFLVAKLRIVTDVRKIETLKTVRYVESYALQEEKEAAATTPPA